VLVVAGNVDVAGIITIYIGLLLRLSYQDNGAIDATGTLTVTIQITRFFSIDVSANVQYRLRGGKSEMTAKTNASATVDRSLRDAAEKLSDARTSP
jgi:hypothetical protein